MRVHILFGQRKERYAGEYAPEALVVADEFTMDENPEWMEEQVKEHEKNTDYVALRVFEIDLGPGSQGRIREQLIGTPKLTGRVT